MVFKRVLILDDDPASRYLAQLTVEKMNIAERVVTFGTAIRGLEFITAHCLDEQAAKENCPDLILLDLNMPGMDGFDFMEQLELLSQLHLIQKLVVVLSSSDNPKDQEVARALGVSAFMEKPITEEKIMALLTRGGHF